MSEFLFDAVLSPVAYRFASPRIESADIESDSKAKSPIHPSQGKASRPFQTTMEGWTTPGFKCIIYLCMFVVWCFASKSIVVLQFSSERRTEPNRPSPLHSPNTNTSHSLTSITYIPIMLPLLIGGAAAVTLGWVR